MNLLGRALPRLLALTLGLSGLASCGVADDPSGATQEELSQAAKAGGGDTAKGGGTTKVTICHIPPGNPANAHTITVGEPAVKAHLAHGDTMGACGGGGGGSGSGSGGGSGSGSGGGGGEVPSCQPVGGTCATSDNCCAGLVCLEGACIAF